MKERDPICALPAHALASKLKHKALSAVDALEAHLARVERHNKAINAVVAIDAERARDAAKRADEALERGDETGPLHGVPMTLKDGHEVAGLRSTLGAHLVDHIASADGAVAARLRAAGAIVIGHTNVPPWLADHQTNNPIFGRTNNPWDTARTAGGSSGGAAAAVAAGMTPLEVGSDLVGSIRIPAHFCGVYGLKTTEHRVPLTGFFRLPFPVPRSVRIISSLGPIARDLDDLELALSIIAGPDALDSDVPPVPVARHAAIPVSELRLAFAQSLPGTKVASNIKAAVVRVASLAAMLGARVEERLPNVDWEKQNPLFGDLLATITGLFDPSAGLRDEQRSLAHYLANLERRDGFIAAWEAFFHDLDALIMPAAMTTAFTHRDSSEGFDVDGERANYGGHGELSVFSNLTGLPALVAPAGQSDCLPIGVQIIGPLWSEVRLLAIARALERAEILPGFQPPPGY